MLLPQPNYFNFWAKKLAHQRCTKMLVTILPSTTSACLTIAIVLRVVRMRNMC